MGDKDRERSAVVAVYRERDFLSIVETENPDFLLCRARHAPFGVEVTELHLSESRARLRHIPGYTTRLIEGGLHRHRDDIEALPVVDVEIFDPDGTRKSKTKGIIQRHRSLGEYVQALIARVINKNLRVVDYCAKASHVNLIVVDHELQFFNTPLDSIYRNLFTHDLKQSVAASGFREVFLLAMIENERWVYFPLKLIALLSSIYLVQGCVLASWGEELAEDDAALFEGIAAFLLRSGVPVMFADAIESSSAVWLGNWGISVLEDETKILDQADYPLPPLRTPQLSKSVSFMATEEFRLSYAEYIERNVFISGIAFDAHSAPQLASRAIIGKDFQAEA